MTETGRFRGATCRKRAWIGRLALIVLGMPLAGNVEAQVPEGVAGTYAGEIDGRPAVLALQPSGQALWEDHFAFVSACAGGPITLGTSLGVVRKKPGRTTVFEMRTLGRVESGGETTTSFVFQQIDWTFRARRTQGGTRIDGQARIQFFDSLAALHAGEPTCLEFPNLTFFALKVIP